MNKTGFFALGFDFSHYAYVSSNTADVYVIIIAQKTGFVVMLILQISYSDLTN